MNFQFLIFLLFFQGGGIFPVVFGFLYENIVFCFHLVDFGLLHGFHHGRSKTGIKVKVFFSMLYSQFQPFFLICLFVNQPLVVHIFQHCQFVVVLLAPGCPDFRLYLVKIILVLEIQLFYRLLFRLLQLHSRKAGGLCYGNGGVVFGFYCLYLLIVPFFHPFGPGFVGCQQLHHLRDSHPVTQ